MMAFSPLSLPFCISKAAIVRIHEDPTLEVLWEYLQSQPLFLLVLFFKMKIPSLCCTHNQPCDLRKVTPSL